MLIWRIRN